MTFPAGVTNVSFNVLINNDNILEVNEEFSLIIRHSSSSSITTGSPHNTTVIILNDDSKCIVICTYFIVLFWLLKFSFSFNLVLLITFNFGSKKQ